MFKYLADSLAYKWIANRLEAMLGETPNFFSMRP